MDANRRGFLFGVPIALFGLESLSELTSAQAAADVTQSSADAADFWVRGMGVPAHLVPGGEASRGRRPAGPQGTNFAREPLFLHYDPDEKTLLPASQIPVAKMLPSGDAKVDFQLVRMRLNPDDTKVFENYASGGIYWDMQQQTSAAPAAAPDFWSEASVVVSAMFPGAGGGAGGKGGGGKGGSGKKPAKGNAFFPQSAPGKPTAPSAGQGTSTVPLQQAKQAQSIALPGGFGKAAFTCFAKDHKKSAFGQFVSALSMVTNSPAMSYLPMLSLPGIGGPALSAIRGLVGTLQSHGGDQQPILQSPPTDVFAVGQGITDDAVRLRNGYYIAVPMEHTALLEPDLSKLKVLQGFLVPKEATEMDIYDTMGGTAPGVSYLSLKIGVAQTKVPGKCA
jgi:hypothetical protein